MKVISWNLNGLLSSVRHGAMIPLEALAPDVVCFQEIRTKQTTEVLPGYHHFWNPSQREGYSGTLTISKEKPLQVIWGLGNERLDQSTAMRPIRNPTWSGTNSAWIGMRLCAASSANSQRKNRS